MERFGDDWTAAHPQRALVSKRSGMHGVDVTIARIIAEGGGIATAADLRAAGVHRNSIRRRLDRDQLLEVFAGVYAYPQDRLEPLTRRRAAVLSCGGGAALTGWSCAEHWEVVTFQDAPDEDVHVVVPAHRRPRRDGITLHRLDTLDRRDLTTHRGVACTTVPRMLLDIAGAHDRRLTERFLDEAAYLGLWRTWEVEALLVRSAGQRGVAVLRAVLDEHRPGTTRTTNAMEEAFLAISDAERWPRPICQLPDTLSNGRRVRHDFIWPDLRFIVETDGGRGHAGAFRQARDRERDDLLRAVGYELVRVPWADVFHRREVVIERVGPPLRARLDAAARGGILWTQRPAA